MLCLLISKPWFTGSAASCISANTLETYFSNNINVSKNFYGTEAQSKK